MRPFLLCLAAVLCACATTDRDEGDQRAPAPASESLPTDLERVLRDYERAWRAEDEDGLAKLFAEDAFVLSNGRPPVRGRAAIRAAYAGAGGPLYLEALDYAASGDVGYIIGVYGHDEHGPKTGKFILALTREGTRGPWLIAGDIDNASE